MPGAGLTNVSVVAALKTSGTPGRRYVEAALEHRKPHVTGSQGAPGVLFLAHRQQATRPPCVGAIERAEKNTSLATLEALADGLGCDAGDLVSGRSRRFLAIHAGHPSRRVSLAELSWRRKHVADHTFRGRTWVRPPNLMPTRPRGTRRECERTRRSWSDSRMQF